MVNISRTLISFLKKEWKINEIDKLLLSPPFSLWALRKVGVRNRREGLEPT
jgi:hypothetical protein